MKQEILSSYGLIFLNCIGLILFIAIFAGALLWVYRRNSKHHYDHMGSMPLND